VNKGAQIQQLGHEAGRANNWKKNIKKRKRIINKSILKSGKMEINDIDRIGINA
jgi:hypothetical protein